MSTEIEQSRGQLHAPGPSRRAASGLLCLTAAILCISGAGLWRYSGAGGLASYAERAVAFGDSDLQLPADLAGNTGRIRVVHFWDPDCACNKETDAHLHYLIEMYRNANVDFYSVQKPDTHGQLAPFLRGALKSLPRIEGMEHLPATPSIAIWAADGKLAYAGPYSAGLVCSSTNSFVEPVLNKLITGKKVEPMGMMAVGCYCPWNLNGGSAR